MRRLNGTLAAALAAAAVACAARSAVPGAAALGAGARLELAGHYSIPPLTLFPPEIGPKFGGLSGLAGTGTDREFFAISDDRVGHRLYRIRVSGEGPGFRVDLLDTVALEVTGTAPRLDPEGIAVTHEGHLLIASEGRRIQDQRVPPSLALYTRSGSFMRQLPVRERFIPNETGEQTRGVRGNAGFESLTLAPGQRQLFTATETALVQDGDAVSFDRGTVSRLIEYVAEDDAFAPRREFIYPLDPIEDVPFTTGMSPSGVVELLALSDDELLSLERTYIEAAGLHRGINRIKLYRVSLSGATDVSEIESLRSPGTAVPVRKTLLLDLSTLDGLPPELNTLDNFEGLAFGPTLSDGSPSLLLVSDDNFNATQRTWFVQLRIATHGR